MSDKRLLSSRELANAREIHYETETGKCGWCRLSWPCRPTLLLDHINALQERLDAADALADAVEGYFSDADWYEGLSPEESVVFYRATATAETEGE